MKFLKEKLKLRVYQQTILATAMKKNTMCVIPTGLGKTYIAIALAGILLKKNQDKVLFMAPTKPLIDQHKKTFEEFFKQKDKITSITGSTPTKKREEKWLNARIIIATPQTVKHDILAGRLELSNFKLVVFDEAHRATGNYAYVSVAKYFSKTNSRYLALTASPGDKKEKIETICKNLNINKIEIRGKNHPEVAPHVKELKTQYKFVKLPKEFKKIKKFLNIAIKERLKKLKNMGFVNSTDPKKFSKTKMLFLQKKLRARIGEGDFEVMQGISLMAAIMKISHAVTLLESESISSLNNYLSRIWEKSKTTKIRAVKRIVSDFHIRVAYRLTQKEVESKTEHPKVKKTREIFKEILSKNKNAKILVFTEFRDNVNQLKKELNEFSVEKFVGQSNKSGKGMSQKEQIEKIEMLKNKEINALICTSVAEEGLDIPAVDYVIFYSPVPSAIRSIQRKGRTGRQKIGNLITLITKNTRDEAYFWVSKNKEKQMRRATEKMSISKTKQQKIKFDIKKEKKIEIIIDNRERGILVEKLYELGAKIKLKNLEVGDFILSDDVVVEKKEVNDFASSLVDRRLFTQAIEMKRNFDKPLLLIEGSVDDMFASRNINPNALRSAMLSLILDYQIPFIFSKNPKESAKYLFQIAKREQLTLKKSISMRGAKRDWPIEKQQQFLVEGLPLVGEKMARELLKKFKSPKKIANASIDELKEINKLGPKKAEHIRKVFDEEIKND